MPQAFRRTLMLAALLALSLPARAAINSMNLGAKYDGTQSNITFRVYSSRATRVEVWVYNAGHGVQESARFTLSNSSSVWSTTVAVSTLRNAGISGAVYYGYRVWGPNWPWSSGWTKGSGTGFITDVDSNGNRFNPNKLLLDPYAVEMSQDPTSLTQTNGTLFATGASYRNLDSGANAPKGIVLAPDTSSFGTKPTRAQKDDIVYEVNVRGLTKADPGVASSIQGTYAGAGAKAAALASLGVTAVEFLPVQETENDANPSNSTTGSNYWGYMTLDYFAPDRRYSSDQSPGGPTREFKAMVKSFHNQGIKVYIDVVYNHTGEGGPWANTDGLTVYSLFSFRGFDNPTYYELTSDLQHPYDNTGVGGNYNTHNPVAQNLIVDSLAYWRDSLGVDGFRFDLASVLGNTCEVGCFNFDKLDSGNALNRIVRDLPPRPAGGGTGIDLIAEPWAIGGNSYQVGGFPSGWSEWNGLYRDHLRQAQNELGVVTVLTGELATRFSGSSDLYQGNGRQPWNSVNFMVAHDGFTLRDLYLYNAKNNNQPWPFGPSDGGDDSNNSWDQAGVSADQRKAARTGFAFLMLSAGTPMMTGGDEFLRTLNGNNNPYDLDSSGNWLNYSWDANQSNFDTYAQRFIAFRKAHASLRPSTFYSSVDNNGNVMEQLRWFQPSGAVADSTYFNNAGNHSIAWRIDGTEFGDSAPALYLAYNGWSGPVTFTLPWPGNGRNWYRVTDTATWNDGANTFVTPGNESFLGGEFATYGMESRSVLLLIAK